MKKCCFTILFFAVAFCCFAQEGSQSNSNNEALPFYSGLSLSLFGFNGSFNNQSSVFGDFVNSFDWEKSSFKLTPYGGYKDESFWKATSSTWLPIVVGSIGIIMAVAGIPVTAFEVGGVIDTKFLGPVLMVGGAGIYALCLFVWM